jgi:hypothetical protein
MPYDEMPSQDVFADCLGIVQGFLNSILLVRNIGSDDYNGNTYNLLLLSDN